MKYQNPKSKFQGNSKHQAPKNQRARPGLNCDWSHDGGAVVNESTNNPPAAKYPFDLGERTARFGEAIVRFSKKIPRGPTNDRLIDQLVGAGTSVGANYCEANEAVSKKDFTNTVSRCVKEAKEAKFFLRMVVASEPDLASEARILYREAHELLLIFGSMRHKCSAT